MAFWSDSTDSVFHIPSLQYKEFQDVDRAMKIPRIQAQLGRVASIIKATSLAGRFKSTKTGRRTQCKIDVSKYRISLSLEPLESGSGSRSVPRTDNWLAIEIITRIVYVLSKRKQETVVSTFYKDVIDTSKEIGNWTYVNNHMLKTSIAKHIADAMGQDLGGLLNVIAKFRDSLDSGILHHAQVDHVQNKSEHDLRKLAAFAFKGGADLERMKRILDEEFVQAQLAR